MAIVIMTTDTKFNTSSNKFDNRPTDTDIDTDDDAKYKQCRCKVSEPYPDLHRISLIYYIFWVARWPSG